jgi:formamidopyrimidine-DNA glycosylase
MRPFNANPSWEVEPDPERGRERQREYIRDMRPTPIDAEFTLEYLSKLIDQMAEGEKKSVKSLLTQDQLIPGLGNAIAQDILFIAKLQPKHMIHDLSRKQRRDLYLSITGTVRQAIQRGGRSDERDLFDRPGGYIRLMDKNAVGQACMDCGTRIEKIQYLGGSCYFCPGCQV